MAQYASQADFAIHGLPAAALDGFTGDLDALLTKASAKINTYLRFLTKSSRHVAGSQPTRS
jgi:hypothetical protein